MDIREKIADQKKVLIDGLIDVENKINELKLFIDNEEVVSSEAMLESMNGNLKYMTFMLAMRNDLAIYFDLIQQMREIDN